MALFDLAGDHPLRVEMRRNDPQSFRPVGVWSLSPVGDFADWSRVDADLRERFDRLTTCVREDQGFSYGIDHPTPVSSAGGVRVAPAAPVFTALAPPGFFNSVPWLLLAALGLLIATRGKTRLLQDLRDRSLLPYPALWIGTLAVRALLIPTAYFHQNGQGPLWVSVIVSPQFHPYGPGYRSLFGWVRWLSPNNPDQGLFWAQSLLAALGPPAALFIARRVGASRWLSLSLALVVALDPILGRLARSESYYGSCASLLLLATAALCATIPARSRRNATLPLLAAALVITQSALLHPLSWVASAMTPLALLVAPGRLKTRLLRFAVASAVVAVTVTLFAGASMLTVLRSPFGVQWAGTSPEAFRGFSDLLGRVRVGVPAVVLLAGVAGAMSKRPAHGTLVGVAALLCLTAAVLADLVGYGVSYPWIHQAYLRLYTPVAVALTAATLARTPPTRPWSLGTPAAVLALALLVFVLKQKTWLRLPTDVLEQRRVLGWRGAITPGSALFWVERAERRVLALPVYANARSRVSPLPVRLDQPFPVLDVEHGRSTFYYRSSLCSTPEGRPLCDQIEQDYALTPVAQAELPSVPSMVGLDYASPTVRIGLYRVAGARQTP